MRKIHKKLDELPKNLRISIVECGVEYPTVTTDNWNDATCPKCLENKEEINITDEEFDELLDAHIDQRL